jgi:hypothetical protein
VGYYLLFPTEGHAILSIFTIAREESDGVREISLHINGKDAPIKTRFLRCDQRSEHVIAIEIWAWNILRKHEQISGITQIKACSASDSSVFGLIDGCTKNEKAIITGMARIMRVCTAMGNGK